jgi:hypothetical protein
VSLGWRRGQRSDEATLRAQPCTKGHPRHDAYLTITKAGRIRLRCRPCQKQYVFNHELRKARREWGER